MFFLNVDVFYNYLVSESSILFGSIVAFMVLTAVIIYAVMKVIVG